MNNWNANTLLSSIKQYWYLYILLCGWSIYYFVKANTMSIGHDEAGTWLNICKIPFQEFFIGTYSNQFPGPVEPTSPYVEIDRLKSD